MMAMVGEQSSALARAPLVTSAPVTLSLPYPVSGNAYWGNRVVKSKKTGKNIVLTFRTHEADAFIQEVKLRALMARLLKPLEGRIAVLVQLYPHRPKDWQKRIRDRPDDWEMTIQRVDLGNCEKVLGDAMNGVAYLDDKQIVRMVKEVMMPDEHGERVVFTFAGIGRPVTPLTMFTGELF